MADLVDGHIPDGYKLMVVAPDDRVVGTLPLDGFASLRGQWETAAKAEAWDEGATVMAERYSPAWMPDPDVMRRNPYRAELAARRAAECGHGANCVTCSETKENEK